MRKKAISRLLTTALMAFFLLGVHDGNIALWRDGDAKPIKVFPYDVSLLPKQEQERLRQGIRIESMEDLNRLIEAYLS